MILNVQTVLAEFFVLVCVFLYLTFESLGKHLAMGNYREGMNSMFPSPQNISAQTFKENSDCTWLCNQFDSC